MKRTLNRSFLIFLLAIAFFAGMCVLCFRLFTQNEDWVQKPFNGHTATSAGLANAGVIYDRNGNILAQSVDGERIYNEDYDVRCSLLHLVGDNSLNISTAVQSTYRTQLTGYNYIWGMGLPQSLRGKNDIRLTVDSETCAAAYRELGDRKGACVVYNYKTGEVLCTVSTNTYDPQNPPEINEENEYMYEGAYLDHVLSSTYTPGSTFKIVTAAAAIESLPDIYERTFYCSGSKEIGGSDVTCMDEHGDISFKDALAHSCNIVFAELAVELGKDKMTKTADAMGFNQSFQVSSINTVKTKYDVSDANENQLAWSGVGQYTNMANPMQMAIMCSAIANGGTPVMPYVVDESSSIFSALGLNNKQQGKRMLSTETAQKVGELMRYTISSYYGDDMFPTLTVCAKTGTAEVGEDKKPNAWSVGYSTDEDAPLAFAVVVENGGYGISTAGPVAVAAMTKAAECLRNQ